MKKTKAIKKDNVISEASREYEASTRQLFESSADMVKNIIGEEGTRDLVEEALRQGIRDILTEDEDSDDDFDVEEVNDDEEQDVPDGTEDGETEDGDGEEEEGTEDADIDAGDGAEDDAVEDDAVEPDADPTSEPADNADDEGDTEIWSSFDDFKQDDGSYDFSGADTGEFLKVFKLMNDDDNIVVDKTPNGDTKIRDNETGAEYIITSDPEETETPEDTDLADIDSEPGGDPAEFEEGACKNGKPINEYDSNVGYTDDYQKKDAMTTDGVNEPADKKSTNSWDKGVPTGTQKPWAGKGDNKPFDQKVSEGKDCDGQECEDDVVEEGPARTSTKLSRKVKSASNGDSQAGRPKRSPNSVNGVLTKEQSESILSKAKTIQKENKQLRALLGRFREALNEAVMTNYNLGKVVRLVTECTTTRDEKEEIVKRFSKEAKTQKESDRLYESYKAQLTKGGSAPKKLDENITATASAENLAEQVAYRDPAIESIRDLMRKLG